MATTSETESKWWIEFKELMEQRGHSQVLEVCQKLDEVDGKETVEAVRELRKLIENTKCSMEAKKNLERRLKLFENRVERVVSQNFGAMIKYLREDAKISLMELQKSTGISPSYINRIETGERKAPSYPIILKLASGLGVNPKKLLEVAGMEEEDDGRVLSIAELILTNNVTLQGSMISRKEKEALINIINKIGEYKWTDDTKYRESLEIVEMINRFKQIADG